MVLVETVSTSSVVEMETMVAFIAATKGIFGNVFAKVTVNVTPVISAKGEPVLGIVIVPTESLPAMTGVELAVAVYWIVAEPFPPLDAPPPVLVTLVTPDFAYDDPPPPAEPPPPPPPP